MSCNEDLTKGGLTSMMGSALSPAQIQQVQDAKNRMYGDRNQQHKSSGEKNWVLEAVEKMRSESHDRVIGCPEGMKPNPAFSPVTFGNTVKFADNKGDLHNHASEAAAANIADEQSRFTVTGGNCPQNPDLVPDFVPDPDAKK